MTTTGSVGQRWRATPDRACFGNPSATLIAPYPPEPSGEGREATGAILRLLHFMTLRANVYVDAFNLMPAPRTRWVSELESVAVRARRG